MYNIDYITIKGLFSHVDTNIKFVQNQSTMIYGLNQDDEECDSNASGKSTIIEGIVLAYTGSTLRDVNREDFINDDMSSCFVECSLTNSVLNEQIKIQRTYYRSKKAVHVLYENGIEKKDITDPNKFNSYIESKIGINRKDLLTYFIIGEGAGKPFVGCTDSEKKDIITRFSNISKIEKISSIIEDDAHEVSEDYKELLVVRNEIDNSIKLIENEIHLKKESFDEVRKTKIDNNKLMIESIQSRIENISNKSTELSEKIVSKQEEIEGINSESNKKESLQSEIRQFESKIDILNKDKRLLKSNLTHNKSLLDDSITCPKCKHDFSLTTETPLSEIKNQILKLDKDIEKIEKEIESINKVVKLKNEQLNSIKSQDFKIRTIKDSIKELQEQKQEIIDDIKQLKSELVELKNKDLLLKKQSVDLQLKPLKAKLDEQNQKLSESQELFELLEQEKRKYDFWEHHFSRKGFISYLANKVVKSIEGMTNLYLKKYNTNLALEINGFTKLKSGELREKIEVFVVKDGSNLGRFNRYSGGQKARINISSVLATHALINNSCESGGLNFLAIDEKFDEALDYRGRKATTQILDSTNITSILISHHSASELDCRNRIQIQFKDKVSKIV